MSTADQPVEARPLRDVVSDIGLYPIEAFEFVQQGLAVSVREIHGKRPDPEQIRHIRGQQLCDGLRRFAIKRWGMLARTVLSLWHINSTLDFGRIVFAMVDAGLMSTSEDDSLEDFRNVFDFKAAFEQDYQIACSA
ncbi:MAG: Minf_1886 family protein [Tepidisphaeraceae bacterium]